MEALLNMIIGAVATLVFGWIYASVNKKALAALIKKGLQFIVKDKGALNKIENQTGVFFIEAGISVVAETPDNTEVAKLIQEMKEKAELLKKLVG